MRKEKGSHGETRLKHTQTQPRDENAECSKPCVCKLKVGRTLCMYVFNVICIAGLSAVDRNVDHIGDWMSAFLVQGHTL